MITPDRQYRSFDFERSDDEMTVEGYAAVFGKPCVLYTDENGIAYSEVIEPTAFDGVDMSNIVMNYNHTGKPVARTRNETLKLSVDDTGLKISAYLGGTGEGRALYEEIKGGYIDRMSFCFDLSPEQDRFDPLTHTRTISTIAALYDVAAVDQPAYESTILYARSAIKAEAQKVQAEAEKRARQILKLKIQLKRSKKK